MSRVERKSLRLDALMTLEIGGLTNEEVELHGTVCELLTVSVVALRKCKILQEWLGKGGSGTADHEVVGSNGAAVWC